MFIIKWWRFCRGYLVISLKGRGVERLLNLAIMRGIGFWDLQKMQPGARFSIYLTSFKVLRPLIRKTRCHLHIVHKVGLPFWKYRLRRRWGLVVGVVLFIAALYTSTSLVWFVRVTGNKDLEEAEVLQLVEQLGIRPGVWKRKLNLPELEEELARMHGDIAWAGIRVRGTLVEIEIVEHLPEPEIDDRPADIVAAKDGLIERILVLAGVAAVAPGDTVSKGDILIRGMHTFEGTTLPEDEQSPEVKVRARGEVEARVWYEVCVEIAQKELIRTETGQYRKEYYLQWPDGKLPLWRTRQIPFDNSRQEVIKWSWRWRNLSLPVELVTVTIREVLIEVRELPRDEALQKARDEAVMELRRQLPAETPVGQLYFQEYTENARERLRAVAETREDITEIRILRP